ncbi:hypothetical protein CK503_11185 [Aliifodinibius salipaludis]|uniref:Thiamine biosynthesis protein ThiF n=1 Tax=Fodinibius salipaludis TaxID=2032627 RepID=A0A2A2GA27_9BACT|nr:ThiF family adenylyltransferase [Aliifodinibius salipaludis]PAU93707.1 hypothetical protein CK503_11185 [Aliifodinibius salipaludis]
MEQEYYTTDGNSISEEELSSAKAKAVLELIKNPNLDNFFLVEVKANDDFDVIVFDIFPQVPQKPSNDIRSVERIATHFHKQDKERPGAYVLRKDFPEVKHIYNPKGDSAKQLCLTIEPYIEEKYYWTASGFLKSIFNWLSKTSKGILHEEDQPLEEFYFESPHRILLPNLFFDNNVDEIDKGFICRKLYQEKNQTIALLDNPDKNPDQKLLNIFIFETPPVVHSIPQIPSYKLGSLHQELQKINFNLASKLATKLFAYAELEKLNPGNGLILLVRIPKKRDIDSEIEEYELQAFFLEKNLKETIKILGLKTNHGNIVLGDYDPNNLLDLSLLPLNPTPYLTPSKALEHNGLEKDIEQRISLIGLGALGSQIADNIYRSGFNKLSLIDHDKLLPHNLARHTLDGTHLGEFKVKGMKNTLSSIFENNKLRTFTENVLHQLSDDLKQELENSDLILDFSASNIVSKYISNNIVSNAPRISCFLNPNGKDSILIKEDLDRHYQLDTLELDYYRGIYRRSELHNHLDISQSRIGYAYNCRDVSSQMPQINVAQHSAILSRSIINSYNKNCPLISIWRTNQKGETNRFDLACHKYQTINHRNWEIKISSSILEKIYDERSNKLPNETGGVLVGYINTKDEIIYISDSLKSPSDSIEYPDSYTRGKNNLLEELEKYDKVTANQITYIGEWHSHPDNCSVDPSPDDKKLFEWLKTYREIDSLPPVMLIVGDDNRLNFLVEEVTNSEILYA